MVKMALSTVALAGAAAICLIVSLARERAPEAPPPPRPQPVAVAPELRPFPALAPGMGNYCAPPAPGSSPVKAGYDSAR